MDALVQQLDSYSRLGIPKLQHSTINFEAEDLVDLAGDLSNLPKNLLKFFHEPVPFQKQPIINLEQHATGKKEIKF